MEKTEYMGYNPQGKKIVLISKDNDKNRYYARSSRETETLPIEANDLGEYLSDMFKQGFTILQ
jgi:hypothetical protein